jgi:hypothetical protein
MTGSVALDVVIGLVFIYLLYSLLATIICEIISLHLGLRARNLQRGIRRMLEDSPQVSEVKIVAFFKNIWHDIYNQFFPKEGPGTCVFYHLPSIKYLGRNTYYSKPSYITRQNFSKGILEIFRRYGGTDDMNDLQKIQNVLKGALEYPGILKNIKEEILRGTQVDPEHLDKTINYVELRNLIESKVNASGFESLDEAQRKLFSRIKDLLSSKRTEKNDKAAIYMIDEMLNLFGHETRSHLASLLKDANNDLVKFRFQLEHWFDDTMDRATGWYKQKVQFVLLMIGLVMAVWFNANTIDIVKKLSVDTDARDKLVQMATEYVKDPGNKLPEGLGKFSAKDSLKIDSIRKVRLDSLEKVRVKLQQQMDNANSLLGLGWKDLPDSLPLLAITKENSTRKFGADTVKIKLDDGEEGEYVLLLHKGYVKNGILSCLDETTWYTWFTEDAYECYNKKKTKISVDHNWFGDLEYSFGHLFSAAGWGFLLTALAISLGAPFWFDMLNKLVQIRGVVRQPTQAQVGDASTTGANAGGDPAHVLNRKG